MGEAIAAFVDANLALAAAVGLIAVIRRPVRTAFGARTSYGLWLLVPLAAAASLLPPRIVEAPSVPLVPAAAVAAAGPAAGSAPGWASDVLPAHAGIAAPAIAWDSIAVAVWVLGMLAMTAWLAVRQLQFARSARAGEAGPAVTGVLRPRIVVPADFETRFDRRERAVVLAHEAVHLGRQDARLNAIVALVRCVCWFNPLVHLGAHLMRLDQEMACDAAVVEAHPRARGAYAQALLKAQLTARPLPLGCYWPAGTEHPLTERIAMLKTARPTPARRFAGGALIAAIGALGGYAAWAAQPPAIRVAQAPAAPSQGVLSAALGAPAQAKVAAPTPAPGARPVEAGVKPTTAGWDAQTIAEALAANRVQDALDHGATAADILDDLNKFCRTSGACARTDPSTARFIREGGHISVLSIGAGLFKARDGTAYNLVSMPPQLSPPGGLDSLPILDDLLPLDPPSASQVAVSQVLTTGGSAADAAKAYFARMLADPAITPAQARQYQQMNPTTARWVQSDRGKGRVGLGYLGAGNQIARVVDLPGSEAFPGRGSLPTLREAFPPPPPATARPPISPAAASAP